MVRKLADIIKAENSNAIQNANDFNIPVGFICTVDVTTLDGKLALGSALNGAVTMRDKVGDVLEVQNIVTTQGTRARTGEMCTNSFLICKDGTVYMSQSDGIARSLKVIVALFTDANTGKFVDPTTLGVGLQIIEQTLANGNTLKSLVPVKL